MRLQTKPECLDALKNLHPANFLFLRQQQGSAASSSHEHKMLKALHCALGSGKLSAPACGLPSGHELNMLNRNLVLIELLVTFVSSRSCRCGALASSSRVDAVQPMATILHKNKRSCIAC